MSRPPLLVLGWGNPGRGDDGLGPALVDALQDHPALLQGELELQTDFQLQVEHALDLQGRRAVLLVDAQRDAPAGASRLRYEVQRPQARRDASFSSHALSPQALLQVLEDLQISPPPCWLLGLAGSRFELGQPISARARINLASALHWVQGWLEDALDALRSPSSPAHQPDHAGYWSDTGVQP